MDAKQIWGRLAAFGLDENEARLYFHLSQAGPQRASELADITGIHRTDVYRLTKGLVDKGFVERTLERPVRFAPRPLEEAVRMHTEQAEQAVTRLQEEGRRIVQEWPRSGGGHAGGSVRFVVHQGIQQVRSLVERMVGHGSEEVLVSASAALLQRLALDEAVVPDGAAPVRVLTDVRLADADALRRVAAHAEVRHAPAAARHPMVVVDGRELALFVASGSREQETVLWLNAPEHVASQRRLLRSWWERGVDLHEVLDAAADGRRPRQVDTVRGAEAAFDRLRSMLLDAPAILAQCSPDELRRWRTLGLDDLVQARVRQGADVRMLVAADGGDGVEDLPFYALPARHAWPLTVAATMQGEVLVVRPSDDPWGIVSSLPEAGMWVWHLLEAQWDEARLSGGSAAAEASDAHPQASHGTGPMSRA